MIVLLASWAGGCSSLERLKLLGEKPPLSAIENRAKMSRGQLTYYFRKMEHIQLAVFDHLLEAMRKDAQSGKPPDGHVCGVGCHGFNFIRLRRRRECRR